jgi:hypothetical protein
MAAIHAACKSPCHRQYRSLFAMTKRRDAGSARAALEQLFDQCGGVGEAAAFLGRSKHHLHHCTDPDDDRDLGLRAVSQLTRAFDATAVAEHLAAQAGGVFVPGKPSAECIKALRSRSAVEWGEWMAAALSGKNTERKELEDVARVVLCLLAHPELAGPTVVAGRAA